MRILLTNDDGVNATGLKVLETDRRALLRRHLDRRAERGAIGRRPFADAHRAGPAPQARRAPLLRDRHADRRGDDGPRPHPRRTESRDLILSGVNRGANLGEDVTYSGTVSAAMEGALAGIPSIALSQSYAREGMGDTVPFAAAEAWAERVLRAAARDTDSRRRTLVNINFPALAAGRGEGRSRRPPGHSRLWPAPDRQAHRSARLQLLLVRPAAR